MQSESARMVSTPCCVCPGLDGLFDVGLDAGFQLGEQLVLLGDGQGQQGG